MKANAWTRQACFVGVSGFKYGDRGVINICDSVELFGFSIL